MVAADRDLEAVVVVVPQERAGNIDDKIRVGVLRQRDFRVEAELPAERRRRVADEIPEIESVGGGPTGVALPVAGVGPVNVGEAAKTDRRLSV